MVHTSPLIARTEADGLLRPLYPILDSGFQHAWNWVQGILDQDPDRRATLSPSTVAAMVYERFVRLLVPLVQGLEGVKIEWTGRMARLRITDRIVLRFKRLDQKLRSRNVRTKKQRDIYHQRERLFDVSDGATAITFGYIPGINNRVRGVYVTCPKNWRENEWMIALRDETSSGTALFSPEPLPPTLPLPQIAPVRRPGEKIEGA